ncbi:MAG: hypothetical protein Q7W13_07320 [Bacteroidia bacterium]|nr:hypothetical protein [Bacteroidia bacterium]
MILIASSLSLLAVVAGMFLYAKTIKEELNRFFKIVSLFIIIVGFLNLFAGSAYFMMKKIYTFGAYYHNMGSRGFGHHGNKFKKQTYMHMKCDRMCDENYECRKQAMCCDEMMAMGNEDCCPSGMGMNRMMKDKSCCMPGKMVIKKDSVIMKR